jgi:hypothetical protein
MALVLHEELFLGHHGDLAIGSENVASGMPLGDDSLLFWMTPLIVWIEICPQV